jgi:hypothetical protein
MHPSAHARKKNEAAVTETNLPIQYAAIVEIARDSGTLQNRRSIKERCRKLCRFENQAAR